MAFDDAEAFFRAAGCFTAFGQAKGRAG